MIDTNLLGYLGIIFTVLTVGVGLAGLVLKLHNDTNQRIDDTNDRIDDTNRRITETNRRIDDTNRRIDEFTVRFVELEKSQARLEGFLAGMQSRTPPSDQ